jgi:hypothetical protein
MSSLGYDQYNLAEIFDQRRMTVDTIQALSVSCRRVGRMLPHYFLIGLSHMSFIVAGPSPTNAHKSDL